MRLKLFIVLVLLPFCETVTFLPLLPSPSPKMSDEWLDILDNGQILKKIVKAGDATRSRPEKGCRVTIHLEERLKETSSSFRVQKDLKIFVGDCDLYHGIDLVVPLMNVGEISQVILSHRFAFGEKGLEPNIPPSSDLDLTIELISIDWIEELNELDPSERIKIGAAKKELGNFYFSRCEYSNSATQYRRAVEFLDIEVEDDPSNKEITTKANELRAAAYNNLAQTQIKMETYDAALSSVNNSLAINENNVKALFRKGKILTHQNELREAVEVFKTALKLDPENNSIRVELSQVAKAYSKQLEGEKELFRKMLQLSENGPSATTHPDAKSGSSDQRSRRKWSTKTLVLLSSIGFAAIGAVLYQILAM